MNYGKAEKNSKREAGILSFTDFTDTTNEEIMGIDVNYQSACKFIYTALKSCV